MGEEPYYTVKHVMRLTGYSLRQVERFLEKGMLEEVDHQPHHQRKISQASVGAFLDTRGIRPIDEVEVLKQEQQEQKQAIGEVARQVAALKVQVDELGCLLKRMYAKPETKIRIPGGQRARGSALMGPAGAMMLVDFAEAHGVTIGKLRGLVERDPTLVTGIERPNAQHKKHQWIIMPEQMAPMLAALEKQGTFYTPCVQCPHKETGQSPLTP